MRVYARTHTGTHTDTRAWAHNSVLSPSQALIMALSLESSFTVLSSDTEPDIWFKVHPVEGKDRSAENIFHLSFIIGPPELWGVALTPHTCFGCRVVLSEQPELFHSPFRSSKDRKVALKISQEYWTWKWNSSAELVTTDTLASLFQIETGNIQSLFSQHLVSSAGRAYKLWALL